MSHFNKKVAKSVIEVTKNVNKKGRLKGRNKKETKALRGMCPHHKLNKRGNLKPTLMSGEKGYCECSLCGARVRTKFYTNDEVDAIVGAFAELNSQAKYAAVATSAGSRAIDMTATAGIIAEAYPKVYKRIRNIAQSRNRSKNKKKRQDGSSAFGSWGRFNKKRY